MCLNLCEAVRKVLEGTTYIYTLLYKKEERSQKNNLNYHLKKLRKEE